ncbi:MAG: HVA1 family protein, partial [Pseudomonadota bacterium]
RSASKDSPAYLIEQSDGDEVIKSESELEAAN